MGHLFNWKNCRGVFCSNICVLAIVVHCKFIGFELEVIVFAACEEALSLVLSLNIVLKQLEQLEQDVSLKNFAILTGQQSIHALFSFLFLHSMIHYLTGEWRCPVKVCQWVLCMHACDANVSLSPLCTSDDMSHLIGISISCLLYILECEWKSFCNLWS